MTLLTTTELRRIEKTHAEGISSADVVAAFRRKGERFSAASLRKYVQLGLLPKSRRVGVRGRHRGSSGRYPVGVVRLINEIKRALDGGATLEEIRASRVGVTGELEALQRVTDRVMTRFAEAIRQQPEKARRTLKQTLDRHKKAFTREARELNKLAIKLGTAGAATRGATGASSSRR